MQKNSATVFRGCATALITPFLHGRIDYDSFISMIERNLALGADALVIAGTTGEASTLSPEEQVELCACAVHTVGGRVPVIGGAGSNDTAHACALARAVSRTGVDALLCVTPYYNKATPRGIQLHFEAIAEASEKPIILYNVPARTGCEIPLSAYAALAAHPNVCGVKEASGDIVYAQRVMRECGDALPLYSGCDRLTLPLLSLGAQGVISVVSNLVPSEMHELCAAWFAGDCTKAARMQQALLPLMDATMAQPNPVPVKTACALMGLCRDRFRLPLCPMSPEEKESLEKLLASYGLTE